MVRPEGMEAQGSCGESRTARKAGPSRLGAGRGAVRGMLGGAGASGLGGQGSVGMGLRVTAVESGHVTAATWQGLAV